MNEPNKAEPRTIETAGRPQVSEPLLKWKGPEFLYHEKDRRWFLLAGLLAVALLIVTLILHQWIASLVVVAMAVAIYQHAGRAPREMEFVITTLGVQVGERLYPYTELKGFWIVHQPPVGTLNLQLTRRLAPQVTLQLGEIDPDVVRATLTKHLPEVQGRAGEDFIDRLARLARF